MRRAPQLGQNPRRLQLNATRCSAWQDSQRTDFQVSEFLSKVLPGRQAALRGRAHGARDRHEGGLDRDTKFDLGNTARLPFDTDWSTPSPNRRFGDHAKQGILNLKDERLRRALQAAILEAREAGRL
jgi:hypothetical protein